jgi:response regulator NasT
MNRAYRIAVADDEQIMRECFERLVPLLGHKVVAAAATGRQLVEECARAQPDLVITDIKMPDMDGIEAVQQMNRERPVPAVLVTGHDSPELVERAIAIPALAYLVKPIKPTDLGPAIVLTMSRFEQLQALRRDAADLKQALEERKVIERAKGIVMHRLRLEESEAHRALQRLAADHNRKLIDVVHEVIKAEQMFQSLEGSGEWRGHRQGREHGGTDGLIALASHGAASGSAPIPAAVQCRSSCT